MPTLNNRVSLHKSNIKLTENRQLYECSKGNFINNANIPEK